MENDQIKKELNISNVLIKLLLDTGSVLKEKQSFLQAIGAGKKKPDISLVC